MRSLPVSRRWLIAGALGLGILALVTLGLAVVYPRVGAWMVRTKVGGKLAARLGRDVSMGKISVHLGHATIYDLAIRGPLDGDTPLVHVDRIDVDFDAWKSLVGTMKLGPAKLD